MADAFSYLVLGFAAGYVWNPLWAIIKKVWTEAQKARKEW